MTRELVSGHMLVGWTQPTNLADDYSYTTVDLLYPLGVEYPHGGSQSNCSWSTSSNYQFVGDANSCFYRGGTATTDSQDTQEVFRDVSASSGVVTRVCNGFGNGARECLTEQLDISPNDATDTRGPVIGSRASISPRSIAPGDFVTVELTVQDISGVTTVTPSGWAFFRVGNQVGDPILPAAPTVGIDSGNGESDTTYRVEMQFPIDEFGCGEFSVELQIGDSVGNVTWYQESYAIEVSCGPPTTTTTTIPTCVPNCSPPVFDYAQEYCGAVYIHWNHPSVHDGLEPAPNGGYVLYLTVTSNLGTVTVSSAVHNRTDYWSSTWFWPGQHEWPGGPGAATYSVIAYRVDDGVETSPWDPVTSTIDYNQSQCPENPSN